MKIELQIPSPKHEFELSCDVAVFKTLLFLNEYSVRENARFETIKFVQNGLYTYGLLDGYNAHDFPNYKVYFGLQFASDFVDAVSKLTESDNSLGNEYKIRGIFREMMDRSLFKLL